MEQWMQLRFSGGSGHGALRIVQLLMSFVFVAIALSAQPMDALAVDAPAKPSHYFNDFASLIDPRTSQQLDQRLKDFERQTSNQIIVLIYPSLPANTAIEDFALNAFWAWKPGQKDKNNGMILFVFVKDRKVRISTGYGLEATLTNEICKRIISDEITPRFQARDFAGGLTAAINAMMTVTKDAYTGTGKTAAEQNAADRQAAQVASPTEASPEPALSPTPTEAQQKAIEAKRHGAEVLAEDARRQKLINAQYAREAQAATNRWNATEVTPRSERDAEHKANVVRSLSTPDQAKEYISNMYKKTGFNVTVLETSAFVPKTLKGVDYLVAKAHITFHNVFDVQSVVAAVIDIDRQDLWTECMSEDDYHQFIETGDQAFLRIPDLNP